MPAAAYRRLEVWQIGMDCVERCYRLTKKFPQHELYGLVSQIRRAAVSIPSNVAEGYCRRTTRVYALHVGIALGSHGELETCIELSHRLGYVTDAQKTDLDQQLASVGRLLSALHRALDEKISARGRNVDS